MKKCKERSLTAGRLLQELVFSLALLVSQFAWAQGKITGQVKDKDGNPVKGATVAVKNKNVTVVSTDDGQFSIAAGSGDILEITSVGYEKYEVTVKDGNNITAQLTTRIESLDDVVVVGYGTQRKKDLTGSVSSININDIKKYSTSDISQLLQGRAPGVGGIQRWTTRSRPQRSHQGLQHFWRFSTLLCGRWCSRFSQSAISAPMI
jgi:hypothetical protein